MSWEYYKSHFLNSPYFSNLETHQNFTSITQKHFEKMECDVGIIND